MWKTKSTERGWFHLIIFGVIKMSKYTMHFNDLLNTLDVMDVEMNECIEIVELKGLSAVRILHIVGYLVRKYDVETANIFF